MTGNGEANAARQDAQQRVTELRQVAARLWADRDDGQVLSELLSVIDQLRAAEAELKAHTANETTERP